MSQRLIAIHIRRRVFSVALYIFLRPHSVLIIRYFIYKSLDFKTSLQHVN